MKLLIVGATGLVGRHVLALALEDSRVREVVAPTRRPLPAHPRLHAPLVDFENLDAEAPWWGADAIISTLGTTMKRAGSQTAFRRVDYDYPLRIASLGRRHGTSVFVLTSARGASASSRFFYNRVKGELERDLAGLGFEALTLVRPGLIAGHRDEFRFGERAAAVMLQTLRRALPAQLQMSPAPNIARALLHAALRPTHGVSTVESESLI